MARGAIPQRRFIHQTGEFMQDIYNARHSARTPPMLMSDVLSANHVMGHRFNKSLYNSHGRRGFVELIEQHPQKV